MRINERQALNAARGSSIAMAIPLVEKRESPREEGYSGHGLAARTYGFGRGYRVVSENSVRSYAGERAMVSPVSMYSCEGCARAA